MTARATRSGQGSAMMIRSISTGPTRSWQLLFQDYSTNNPVIFSNEFPMSDISSYNRWGLPKLFVETEGLSNATIFFYPFYLSSDIQVSYSCDGGEDLGAGAAGGSGG